MAARRSQARKEGDAIALLKADHDKVKKMFKQFEKLHDEEADDDAGQVAAQICNELKIHTAIEEEIFYPELRNAIDDDDMMNEAEVEHASAKELIQQIEGMGPSDDMYAAKVTVLGEYVNHHIKEEQDEMFPKARRAKLDQEELGGRMLERKRELMAQMDMTEEQSGGEVGRARRSGNRPGTGMSRSSHARR